MAEEDPAASDYLPAYVFLQSRDNESRKFATLEKKMAKLEEEIQVKFKELEKITERLGQILAATNLEARIIFDLLEVMVDGKEEESSK